MPMKMTSLITALTFLTGLALVQMPLRAQDRQVMEEVTVMAPRVTKEERNLGVGKTIITSKSAVVDAADLDLSRTGDMMQLEKRVRAAANGVCEDLEDEVPFGRPSVPVCIERAVSDTMAQVRDSMSG